MLVAHYVKVRENLTCAPVSTLVRTASNIECAVWCTIDPSCEVISWKDGWCHLVAWISTCTTSVVGWKVWQRFDN